MTGYFTNYAHSTSGWEKPRGLQRLKKETSYKGQIIWLGAWFKDRVLLISFNYLRRP